MAGASIGGSRRLAALLVVALLIVVPALWIAWSLYAAALVSESTRTQAETLAALRERLSALRTGAEGSVALADAASVFLPGETPAIAGAALQRIVASTVETAGARLAESEITPAQSEEDPGRVDLRASFDTEIVGLQKILFDLETGTPVLLLRGLNVQSGRAAAENAESSPPLRVTMIVGGYWEAGQQ